MQNVSPIPIPAVTEKKNENKTKTTNPSRVDAWVTLFLRYNKPLPSSASIDRVFSYGSAILRPKRATLAAENFEALVFLKGNLTFLRKAHEVEVNEQDEV